MNNFHFAKVRSYADDLKTYSVINNFQGKENLCSSLAKYICCGIIVCMYYWCIYVLLKLYRPCNILI